MGIKEREFKCWSCGCLIGYLEENEKFEYKHKVYCLTCHYEKEIMILKRKLK